MSNLYIVSFMKFMVMLFSEKSVLGAGALFHFSWALTGQQ